jgi:hypothetical protein
VTIDLRDHLQALLDEADKRYQQRFDAQTKAIDAALQAAKEAVTKAETANDKRFECVSSDTMILCADLIWRPAGELRVGDELIAFDEEAEADSGRRGRRFRRSVVTANAVQDDALIEVQTPRGNVRCNPQHPWLVRPQDKRLDWRWVRADNLQYGDAVHHVFDPWTVDTSWESGWLAGMFDGEGCLMLDKNKRTQLSIAQRESPTSDRIDAELRKRVQFVGAHRFEPGTRSTPRNTCPIFHFIVTRLPDVMTLLGSVRPPRLLAKAELAWDRKPLGGWHRHTLVTGIVQAGRGKIAALSTSTKTYIAAGFAMHNSVNEFRQTLSDQSANFMARSEFNARSDAMIEKIDALRERLDKAEGTGSGLRLGWGLLLGGIGLAATIISAVVLLGKP